MFATLQREPEASVEGAVGGDVNGDKHEATLSSLSFARPTATSDSVVEITSNQRGAGSAPVQTTFPNSDVQVHTSIDVLDLSYMYRGFTAAV